MLVHVCVSGCVCVCVCRHAFVCNMEGKGSLKGRVRKMGEGGERERERER